MYSLSCTKQGNAMHFKYVSVCFGETQSKSKHSSVTHCFGSGSFTNFASLLSKFHLAFLQCISKGPDKWRVTPTLGIKFSLLSYRSQVFSKKLFDMFGSLEWYIRSQRALIHLLGDASRKMTINSYLFTFHDDTLT